MFLQEFLYLCLDGVGKIKSRQVLEIKFEDLTCCRLPQSGQFLVLNEQDHGLLLLHLLGLQLQQKIV